MSEITGAGLYIIHERFASGSESRDTSYVAQCSEGIKRFTKKQKVNDGRTWNEHTLGRLFWCSKYDYNLKDFEDEGDVDEDNGVEPSFETMEGNIVEYIGCRKLDESEYYVLRDAGGIDELVLIP